MKKGSLLLILGAAIAFFAYRYFFNGKNNAQTIQRTNVSVQYTGPDIMYMGIIKKSGDIINGDIDSDGNLIYKLWGNGIVASYTIVKISPSNYAVINK